MIRRSGSDPKYSLRIFARHLGVSPATLSGVLSGKRALSHPKALGIIEKLDLPEKDLARLKAEIEGQPPEGATVDRLEMKQLATDVFQSISDWYHYGILELTYVRRKKFDAHQVARELRCTYVEAADALERLQRLGLITERDGRWVKTETHTTTGTDFPSNALRRLHMQFLEKAKHSLLTDAIDQRDFTSMTMAVDSSKLSEAKKRITTFRRELCQLLESGRRDRVYTLTVNLFPLSYKEKGPPR